MMTTSFGPICLLFVCAGGSRRELAALSRVVVVWLASIVDDTAGCFVIHSHWEQYVEYWITYIGKLLWSNGLLCILI